jgi:hypothetical protein
MMPPIALVHSHAREVLAQLRVPLPCGVNGSNQHDVYISSTLFELKELVKVCIHEPKIRVSVKQLMVFGQLMWIDTQKAVGFREVC